VVAGEPSSWLAAAKGSDTAIPAKPPQSKVWSLLTKLKIFG
jgi:hypothetical protein